MAKKISPKYRELLDEFQKRIEATRRATELRVPVNESPIEKKKRIAHLLSDYNAFSQFYFPHYCKSPSAKFHIKLAETLKNNKNCMLVRKWARGHSKSVNACMIAPIWLMLLGELKFMLLVSNTEDNATGLLNCLQAELTENQLLINDFGEFVGKNWEIGDFTTSKRIRFKALGRGQSPRGLRNGASRPDYIAVDDIDDDKLVQNPVLVQRCYDWCLGALYGCFPFEDVGRFVFLGNLISTNSILQKVCDNPMFEVEQINLLDENGVPSWAENEELQKVAQQRIETMGFRLSQREYFNNPITEGSIYKKDWFQYKKRLALQDYQALVCYTDPSFKSKGTNDYKATVLIGKHGGEYHILKAFIRQTTVGKMVDWHYDIWDWVNGEGAAQYWMEANFTQDLLLQDFDKAAQDKGFHIGIRGDTRAKPDKFARIEAMSALFERGFVFISTEEKDSPDMVRLVEQFLLIERGSRAPDDAPDAVEGGIYILNKIHREQEPPIFMNHTSENKNKGYRF